MVDAAGTVTFHVFDFSSAAADPYTYTDTFWHSNTHAHSYANTNRERDSHSECQPIAYSFADGAARHQPGQHFHAPERRHR